MEPSAIIRRPIILTEKGMRLREEESKVLFEVARGANKIEIARAVERAFKVTVEQVNTMNVRGHVRKMGRRSGKLSNWKKAIVTLKKGDKIEIFEGT